jgi:hypothetical protein
LSHRFIARSQPLSDFVTVKLSPFAAAFVTGENPNKNRAFMVIGSGRAAAHRLH